MTTHADFTNASSSAIFRKAGNEFFMGMSVKDLKRVETGEFSEEKFNEEINQTIIRYFTSSLDIVCGTDYYFHNNKLCICNMIYKTTTAKICELCFRLLNQLTTKYGSDYIQKITWHKYLKKKKYEQGNMDAIRTVLTEGHASIRYEWITNDLKVVFSNWKQDDKLPLLCVSFKDVGVMKTLGVARF